MNTQKVTEYRKQRQICKDNLQTITEDLKKLLDTVPIELIDWYSIIELINTETVLIDKIDYLIALEYS